MALTNTCLLSDFVNATRAWISKQKIWPSHVDLSGAATAIVRLHHVYRLSYTPLLQGHFLNVTSQPMTSQELAYVTKAALKLGFICDAKELLSALESLSEREGLEKRASSVLRLRKELSNVRGLLVLWLLLHFRCKEMDDIKRTQAE